MEDFNYSDQPMGCCSDSRFRADWCLDNIHTGIKQVLYPPHRVLLLLATVPGSQAVQEEAPSELILFSSQGTQFNSPDERYVPALHGSENVKSSLVFQFIIL